MTNWYHAGARGLPVGATVPSSARDWWTYATSSIEWVRAYARVWDRSVYLIEFDSETEPDPDFLPFPGMCVRGEKARILKCVEVTVDMTLADAEAIGRKYLRSR
ncbi:hypothetical protein [uncultured Gordonia sp.]|uniref:hypothetical protein n=1 Tax=uncultured Gordonia sp. TaxID=198437 RepID=UPI00258A6DF5|nr:hypothetical protein [uncultured Gordonia sp.]